MPAKKTTPEAAFPSDPAAETLFDQFWDRPDDPTTLRVWADRLAELGDPRGEFIQLSLLESPTPEQKEARLALLKKAGGKLVGPAREHLREWMFGANGLVSAARCEADKIPAGIEALGRVNPRLILTITSLKKKAVVDSLANVSLERIYYVDFTSITGSHGGTQIADKTLLAIAPALKGVRHLALSCRGYADECFGPGTLEKLGAVMGSLRYLWVDYYRGNAPGRDPLPPPDEYARAIDKGFPALRALHLGEASTAAMGRPGVRLNEGRPATRAAEVEALVG